MSRRVFTMVAAGLALALLVVLGWRTFAGGEAIPADARREATNDTSATGTGTVLEPVNSSVGDPVRTAPVVPHPIVRIVDEHGAPVDCAAVRCDVADDLLKAQAPLPLDVEARLASAPRATSGV